MYDLDVPSVLDIWLSTPFPFITFLPFALYISAKPFVYGRLQAFLSVLFCLLSNL